MPLLLFDIDGTLIHSGGAGKRAMNIAFETVFGVANALDGIPLAGCTDLAIVDAAIRKFGIENNPCNLDRFRERYFEQIHIEINRAKPDMRIMPGVTTLLNELRHRPTIYLGLLTGNWEYSGRVKLAALGLNDYFEMGAFADDSAVRHELLPVAVRRYENKYHLNFHHDDVYVIGDTLADVEVALINGVKSIAVATGPISLQTLNEHHADFVFNDLSDTKRFLEIFY